MSAECFAGYGYGTYDRSPLLIKTQYFLEDIDAQGGLPLRQCRALCSIISSLWQLIDGVNDDVVLEQKYRTTRIMR